MYFFLQEKQRANKQSKNAQQTIVNIFYVPKLFAVITKRLHLMPFWTSVMPRDWEIANGNGTSVYRSRINGSLHNNIGEKFFDLRKNKLFLGKEKFCSEFAYETYQQLEATHIEYFPNQPDQPDQHNQPNHRISKRPKDPNQLNITKTKIFKHINDVWKPSGIRKRYRP